MTAPRLPRRRHGAHGPGMFALDEDDATAISAAFDKGGERAAAVELQHRFPALTVERARAVARMIIGPWPGARRMGAEPDRGEP